MFFGGGGNIHKGLDLLLEAFADTELHLHICQHIDPTFAKVYQRELTQCPNIHVYGPIPMRSSEFERLASQCNWTISATCAEGQPGATLECTAYGLIPILSHNANIDLEDFGILLPDCPVETIRAVVLETARMSVEECKRRSFLTSEVIRCEYSPERFRQSFKKALERIVNVAMISRMKHKDDENS